MKKLKLFLLAFFSLGLLLGANAQQDTIKHLIFSEHRSNGPYETYIELANVGTETIDLSKVTIAWVGGKTFSQDVNGQWKIDSPIAPTNQKRLSGTLAPGATWIGMNVSDRYLDVNNPSLGPDHRLDLMAKADWINHAQAAWGFSKDRIPEWEMWGKDSLDFCGQMMWTWGNYPFVLFNHLSNGDSIMIDQVLNKLGSNGMPLQALGETVAGVPGAARYYTMVRKASVKTGNMSWASQNGVDAMDSEWQVFPNQPLASRRSFTTVKTHGAFQLNVSSSIVDIDIPNTKMTVPWGVYRGDSILSLLDIGPGQAWGFVWDSSFVDSTHSIIMDGDILTIYTTGNELKQTDFKLTVAAPAADQANVFPVRDKRYNDDTPPVAYWAQPYYVTHKEPVIDTIGNVPYAARVDSLFKYLEKAPKASWKIVWKDNEVRADLQKGDILKVTAENGTTIKDYYIDVQDYAFSDNVNLNAITWPDKSEFLENWKNDTIPQFTSTKTLYKVIVPYGTINVPALVAHPANINSKLSTKRAISLTGSLEERSTVFSVTSESDTLTRDYTVIFELEKDPSKVQLYKGDPFFSEVLFTLVDFNSFLEIVNPRGVPLDMSEYLIVRTDAAVNPGDAITSLQVLTPTAAGFQNRYRSYVPGYKFYEDTASWLVNPGILSIDANVNPIVEPGGTFVLALSGHGRQQYIQSKYLPLINKHWIGVPTNLTANGVNVQTTPPFLVRGASAVWLFHIENDAVLEGTKAVGDPMDYRLIDVLGDPIDDNIWKIAGRDVQSNNAARMRMKPHIYNGTTSLIDCMDRFGTAADNSGWILEWYTVDYTWQAGPEYIGSHVMNSVTAHLSTVTSPVYLVSDGYAGTQTIQGDLASTTVEAFFANVTKGDIAQTLSIHSGVDGSVKGASSAVVGTDTLVVISADGTNTSSYALTNKPLDGNAVLTTENASLTITQSGATGTVTGVVYGSLLKDIVADVKVPSLAVMNIINGNGELIPLQQLDNNLVKVDTKVSDDVYFEVTAQNLVTVIKYKLEPAALSSDAFVISTLYSVDQDYNLIHGLADGTSIMLFYKNIDVVKGATTKVFTKLGHERVDGQLAYDDVLQVVSEDGTVTRTYFIAFVNETTPDSNAAPQIILAFSDSTIAVPGTLLLSATADDDGLPPPAKLTYLWEVTSANAADVVIENANALNTNVTFNAKAEYTLRLSVSDGAMVSNANVVVNVGYVGVKNSITPTLRLYPNPAKNKLIIELTNMPEQTSIVSIFDVTGSVIYNTVLSTAKNEINISGFESGLYFVKINSGNRSITQRIQIQN